MQAFSKLGKKARVALALGAAASISGAAMVAVPGTLGAFTASSSNTGNNFDAGSLAITNGNTGSNIINLSNMEPGDTVTKTVTITNAGTLPADFYLSESVVTHGNVTGGTGTGNLAHELQLTVTDTTTGKPIYSTNSFDSVPGYTTSTAYQSNGYLPIAGITGAVPAYPTRWAVNEAHTLQFTVKLPSNADDTYQGTNASATFNWTSVAGH